MEAFSYFEWFILFVLYVPFFSGCHTNKSPVILILVVYNSVSESGRSWFAGTACTLFALISFSGSGI